MERKIIDLDQGWDYMQKGITKLKNILEGLPEKPFCSEEYIMLYTYPFSGIDLKSLSNLCNVIVADINNRISLILS